MAKVISGNGVGMASVPGNRALRESIGYSQNSGLFRPRIGAFVHAGAGNCRMDCPAYLLDFRVIFSSSSPIPMLSPQSQASRKNVAPSLPIWRQLPDYPGGLGVAGVIAGQHNGVLIAAGGTNFPHAPMCEGGKRITQDAAYVLWAGRREWLPAGRLREARAYAATISVPGGIFVAGGENSDGVRRDCYLMRWESGALAFDALPDLPGPRASAAISLLDGTVYVAGGFEPGAVRQSTGDFWSLDLANIAKGWIKLPSWPGPSRGQATMAVLQGSIFLISGLRLEQDPDAVSRTEYLVDTYRYQPAVGWEKLPSPPRSTVAAPTPAPVAEDRAQIYILGGVAGPFGRGKTEVPRIENDILVFDAKTGAWTIMPERWPQPVATGPAVRVDDEWVIVSGEVKAGKRTPQVWAATFRHSEIPGQC